MSVRRCDDNATSWTELVKYLGAVAKPAGVTSVSLCAYRVKADGSFGYRASATGHSQPTESASVASWHRAVSD